MDCRTLQGVYLNEISEGGYKLDKQEDTPRSAWCGHNSAKYCKVENLKSLENT